MHMSCTCNIMQHGTGTMELILLMYVHVWSCFRSAHFAVPFAPASSGRLPFWYAATPERPFGLSWRTSRIVERPSFQESAVQYGTDPRPKARNTPSQSLISLCLRYPFSRTATTWLVSVGILFEMSGIRLIKQHGKELCNLLFTCREELGAALTTLRVLWCRGSEEISA